MAKSNPVPDYLENKPCHCPKHLGLLIPINEFSRNPQGADGLNTMCKWGRQRERWIREGKTDPLGNTVPVSREVLRQAVTKLGPQYLAALDDLCR